MAGRIRRPLARERARPATIPPVPLRIELRRDQGRHTVTEGPWIRRRQIAKTWGPPDPAALALVTDHRGEAIGWGLVSPESEIAVRLVNYSSEAPPDDWLGRRLAAALEARDSLGLAAQPTTGLREVNSEGDGVPGLVIDRYGDDRVLQITTAAIAARAPQIVAWLRPRARGALYVTAPTSAAEREGFAPEPLIQLGDPPPAADHRLSFLEHGLPFQAPAPPSQKTGAYFDQRENRRTIAQLAAAHGGPLLDLGTHLGGFAVHAARAGVTAIGLDQSAKALDFARGNAARCGVSERLTFAQGDLFGPLDQPELAGPFGVIVVDPPKIASSARDLPRATRALAACLSNLAPRVAPRGYLVVCSCSHHISGAHLDAAVAGLRGRWTRTLALGPGPDHPVAPCHVQGEYLRVHVYQAREAA